MKTFKIFVLHDALDYHLRNEISLSENVFRYGSEAFFELYNYARTQYELGNISCLSEDEKELLESDIGKFDFYEGKEVPLDLPLEENVELEKPKRGGSRKFYVYVKDPKTDKVKKIEFGDTTGLQVKIDDPVARKSFAARHNCAEKTDKMTPGYWACRLPRYAKSLGLAGNVSKDAFW